MTVLVYVNEFAYVVDDSNVATTEALIVDAVHAGGAFINLCNSAAQPVRVLVTPATPVRVEKMSPRVEPSHDDDIFPDFESYELEI